MIASTTDVQETGTIGSLHPPQATNRLGVGALLLLSAWCGLVAGLLEVVTILLRKQVIDPDQLYKMSRHFVWLIPLSNLGLFLILGVFGCGVMLVWPRRGCWLWTRTVCAFTLLPTILVAFPRIYALASLVVALGVAAQLVPRLERDWGIPYRFVVVSFPAVCATVAIEGAWLWVGDRIGLEREHARTLPRAESPNILLIVLDSVAAGHLQPARLRSEHQHYAGRASRARHPIRFRPGGFVLDASIACDHVYGALVARALRRLAHSPGPNTTYAGGVPPGSGLCHSGFRRQYFLLRHRFGAGPRLYVLPGFHLPQSHCAQDGRAGPPSPRRFPDNRLSHGELARIRPAAPVS